MAVYLDHVHLTADSLDELHEFAQSIGLKRSWFQCPDTHPHYDVLASWRHVCAVNMGAEMVSSKVILQKAKLLVNDNKGNSTANSKAAG